jgi:hypothetical protein
MGRKNSFRKCVLIQAPTSSHRDDYNKLSTLASTYKVNTYSVATQTSGGLVSVNPSALGCASRDTATFFFGF